MTKQMKKWLLGATLAGATAISAAGWGMSHHGGKTQDPARVLAHMSEKLDLSSEQQTEVSSLLAAAKQANAPDRQRMMELREQLMAQRDNFDATEARKLADEIGQVTGRLVFRASETWSRVYQLLTAEQRAELETLMAKREAHRGKRHKGGGNDAD